MRSSRRATPSCNLAPRCARLAFKTHGRLSATRAIVMPGQTDLYFPPEDNLYEVSRMPNAEYRPIPSIWGHCAGLGVNPDDTRFIDTALRSLLQP